MAIWALPCGVRAAGTRRQGIVVKVMEAQFQRYGRRLLALALLSALYLLARLPGISPSERDSLASRFRFDRADLPVVPGPERRSVRPVHPGLRHISAWISAVGAGVALNDIDDDGLPNDVCYVDVRTDQVIVTPAPGTGGRYQAFALNSGNLYRRETMAPMGCLPGDMNEDGRTDILVYYWGRTPIAFLHTGAQMNPAGFEPAELIPGGERWYTNSATFADLDGDGHTDLIVSNYFPDGARVLDAHATGDEHMQHSMSRAFNSGRKHLLIWQSDTKGGVQYRDMSGTLTDEMNYGWTLATGAADLDGDLLPEIYFANDFGPDRLWHNLSTPGRLKFELLHGIKTLGVPRSKVLGRDSFKGMGIDFGDVNGDGWQDMFISNIATQYALEESHFLWMSTGHLELIRRGIAPYVDRSEALGLSRGGWGWDTRLADFDNDSTLEALQAVGFARGEVNRWPELQEIAMGNDQLLERPASWNRFEPGDDLSGHLHNPFYVRAHDGRFYDVSPELSLAESHVSRGIAVADVDGDGRLDYAFGNQWEDSQFFHNTSPNAGAFLGLRVRRANGVPVIGAEASVQLPAGRRLKSFSDGGSGHSGKRSPDIHFGLGRVRPDEALPVVVRWRDTAGIHQRSLDLTPGWHIVQVGGSS